MYVDLGGEPAFLGAGPPGVPVVQDRDVAGRCDCPLTSLADPGEFGAELLDLLVRTALLPAWLTIPEWNFSAPCRDCRHWK